MNDDVTSEWLESVVGKLNFELRLLIWDSYRCHLSEQTRAKLKSFNLTTVTITGGCTKFIQAPDVCWNKPFKDRIRQQYDSWQASDEMTEFSKGGNLKAPSKRLMLDWIKKSWNELITDIIRNSFKSCALTVEPYGCEDDKIHCLNEGQPCREARQLLLNYRDMSNGGEKEILLEEEIDEEEAESNEIVIYDDE